MQTASRDECLQWKYLSSVVLTLYSRSIFHFAQCAILSHSYSSSKTLSDKFNKRYAYSQYFSYCHIVLYISIYTRSCNIIIIWYMNRTAFILCSCIWISYSENHNNTKKILHLKFTRTRYLYYTNMKNMILFLCSTNCCNLWSYYMCNINNMHHIT